MAARLSTWDWATQHWSREQLRRVAFSSFTFAEVIVLSVLTWVGSKRPAASLARAWLQFVFHCWTLTGSGDAPALALEEGRLRLEDPVQLVAGLLLRPNGFSGLQRVE